MRDWLLRRHRTAGGSDERAQARHCVRTLVLLQSTGVVEKVHWYDFKDDGLQREYNQHNFGLVRHQQYHCAPKSGVVARSTFSRLTGGATFVELKQTDALYVAHYHRPDNSDLLIVWTTSDEQSVRVGGTLRSATNLVGGGAPVAATVTVSPAPVPDWQWTGRFADAVTSARAPIASRASCAIPLGQRSSRRRDLDRVFESPSLYSRLHLLLSLGDPLQEARPQPVAPPPSNLRHHSVRNDGAARCFSNVITSMPRFRCCSA